MKGLSIGRTLGLTARAAVTISECTLNMYMSEEILNDLEFMV